MKRGLKLGLFLGVVLISLWCVASVRATDYYVNATTGNDSLAGTSPATAWKTISKVNGFGFSAGDNIYFERGEEWREQLVVPSSGSSGSPITFTAYGSGNKPKILRSVSKNNTGDWTDEGGNLWYMVMADQWEVRGLVMDNEASWSFRVENKVNLSTQGEIWWDNPNDRVYIYSTSNPATFYNGIIEACRYSPAINVNDKAYITIDGLDIRYSTQHGIYLKHTSTGDNLVVQNCTLKFNGYDGFGANGAGVYTDEITHLNVNNCNISYAWTGIWNGRDVTGCVVDIQNNTISYTIFGEGLGIAFGGDTQNEISYSGSIIKNNDISEFSYKGISCSHSSYQLIESNTIHDSYENDSDTSIAISLGAVNQSHHQILRNHIYNVKGNPASYDGGVGIDTRQSSNSVMAYNVIHDCTKGLGNRQKIGSGNMNNEWYNNVCYNMSQYGMRIYNGVGEGDELVVTVRNNIFDGASDDLMVGDYITCTGGYNSFVNDASVGEGTGSTYSNATNDLYATDPLFVNASNNDFHLQSNSPCIDNGTDVNLTQDYDGNAVPQGDGIDIGAYEYTGVYYVDATLGNDFYNGLYPTFESGSDGPWQTWNKVRGEDYSAGDTIKFKRGETWSIGNNERWEITENGTAESYITIEDYGSGTKPILDCSAEFNGKTWADEGSNVWSTNFAVSVYRVRLDGVDSGEGANSSVIDGSTYLWSYDGDLDKLYVYATQNPNSEYTNITVYHDNRYAFILNGCNYIKFQNLRIHGGKYSFLADYTANNAYIEINDCDIWYGYYGIRVEPTAGGGGTNNNFTISGNDFDSKLNMIDMAVESGEVPCYDTITLHHECNNWLIKNNTFTGGMHAHIGMTASAGATQGINNNIIEYNTFDGTSAPYIRAFGLSAATGKSGGNIFRYNVIKNMNIRNQLGGENNEVYYNLFYHVTESPVTNHANDSEGLSLEGAGPGECDSNKVYNNVFYDVFNEGLRLIAFSYVSNNIVKNNIFLNCGQGGDQTNICVLLENGVGAGNIIQNNDCYDADTSDTINYKGTVETLAEADANYTEFSSNIASDPLFVNASNNDFHLQYNSPCIDNGTDVNLTQDFEGNTVPLGTNPDIGAYEYNDTVAPTISFSCSPTSVRAGGTITCSCSATDDVDSSPSVSYTVNPSTSSTGTFTTTCTAEDDFGNSASSNISYTISSAGGGSSGGTTTTNVTEETHSWSRITPGVAAIIKNFDEEIGIKQIQIEVHTEAQNVKIIVTKYDDKPANVSVEKSGKVYKYLQIETENLEDKLNRSIITIQVEKNWTSENNVERDDMAMFKFNESYEVWNELETVYTEENETYYYYDVELDSLSYFAIAADVVEEPEEIEEEVNWWLWLVLVLSVIIIIIIIIIIVMYKHKRRGFEKISKITNRRFDRTLK